MPDQSTTSLPHSNHEGTAAFPSTRYQGSKRKIVPWLWEKLSQYDFSSVLDVFGGSGAVSYMFKRMGKEVTYNDLMRWNYLIGLALIENDSDTVSEKEISGLAAPAHETDCSFVSRTFPGIYFKGRENTWIDAVVCRIQDLSAGSRKHKYKSAIAYYALFQACLVKRPFNLFHRKNLHLRLANVSRSFGNKTTWDRPFSDHFRKFAKEANNSVFQGARKCIALNCAASALPNSKFDLVYLDPPYQRAGKAVETADYEKCYHFLEGLSKYKQWTDFVDVASPLRFKRSPTDNPWADSSRNTEAFDELIGLFHGSIVAISYKKFGKPSIDTLVRLLKRHKKRVRVHTRHYKYALNHQNGSAQLNRECLLIAE